MITENPSEFWDNISKQVNWIDYILPKRSDKDFWDEGEQEAKKISKYIEDGSYIIDYGCGIGRITKAMRKKFKNVIGLDICESFINKAGEGFFTNKEYKEKEKATFIYSISVLQHNTLENRKKIMDDIYHLLKKGGKCFINFPIAGNIYRETKFVHTFNEKEIRELAKDFADLKIIKGNLVKYGGKDTEGFNEMFAIATK